MQVPSSCAPNANRAIAAARAHGAGVGNLTRKGKHMKRRVLLACFAHANSRIVIEVKNVAKVVGKQMAMASRVVGAGLPKLHAKANVGASPVKAPAAAAAPGGGLSEATGQLIIDALRKLVEVTATAVSMSLPCAEHDC